MINPQDFYALFFHSIDSHIGQRSEQELSRSLLASDTATVRPLLQRLDGSIQLAQGRLAVMEMMVFEVIGNVL